MPLSQLSGDELTKEPFRWDQRLFSIIIQFPGIILDGYEKVINQSAVVNGDSHYNSICEATGGKDLLKLLILTYISFFFEYDFWIRLDANILLQILIHYQEYQYYNS